MSKSVNEAGGAEAVKGRTPQDVEADVARTIEEMQTLKAERDSLPAQVEEATANLDAVRLEELEGRGRSLRAHVSATQARLWLLYSERARLQLPEAEAAAEAARAEYDRTYAEYLELHARTNRLGVESDNARVRAQGLKWTAEENERRAQALARRLPAELRGSLVRQS